MDDCVRSKEGIVTVPDFEKLVAIIYGPDWGENPTALAAFNNFLDFNARVQRAVRSRTLSFPKQYHPPGINGCHPLGYVHRLTSKCSRNS